MKSGIYRIINIINNKIYIGSAVNLRRRELAHFNKLKHNTHPNIYLQYAYNKYGIDMFKFEVVEYVDTVDLLTIEQSYIDKLQPDYNMCPIAGNTLGRKHRQESIEKIKACSVARKDLEVTKNSLKLGHGWNKGIMLTAEWRAKLSKAKERLYKPVIRISDAGDQYFYKNLVSVKEDGFHTGHVIDCCNGRQKNHKGYRWEYAS